MTILIGGRYEIIEELGRGSSGITFLAHDRHLPNHPIVIAKMGYGFCHQEIERKQASNSSYNAHSLANQDNITRSSN
jgi:serine/threonine protein kinase